MENLTLAIDQAIPSNDYARLTAIFAPTSEASAAAASSSSTLSWHSVGQGEKRSLAAYFISAAVASPTFLPAAFAQQHSCEAVMVAALSHLPVTVEGAADNKLRKLLFDYKLNHDNEYAEAARILGGMRMEDDVSSVYYTPPMEKMDVYVKIAECFLAEDEIAEADAAVNKAGSVAPLVTREAGVGTTSASGEGGGSGEQNLQALSLILRYKSTYARVLDHNRKFLQAAQRYHELSQHALADEDESLQLLGRAITNVLLAPSGQQRRRVLSHLYADARLDRLSSLDEFASHATILRKMVRHEILRKQDLLKFESSLAEHQKAVMGDGLTILERGIVEHNMTAVAHLYRSIYVSELALVLGVAPEKAEKIAAAMIADGTLRGSVDQVDGLLVFDEPCTAEEARDRGITNFCIQLHDTAHAIQQHAAAASMKAATTAAAGQ